MPENTDTPNLASQLPRDRHLRSVRPVVDPAVSSMPGYRAGYQAGKKWRQQNISAWQKQKIVAEWLVEQRAELLLRKSEIDRMIASLSAEEELRKSGFVFPSGFFQTNA